MANEYPKQMFRNGRHDQQIVHDLAGENMARQAGFVADAEVKDQDDRASSKTKGVDSADPNFPTPSNEGRAVKGIAGDDAPVASMSGPGQKGVPHPPGRLNEPPRPEDDTRLPEEKQQEAQIRAAEQRDKDAAEKTSSKADDKTAKKGTK